MGVDLCVIQGDTFRECRAGLADDERKKEERKKEKVQFLVPHGSGCRRSFSSMYMWIPMVRVTKLESVPRMCFCNVLHM